MKIRSRRTAVALALPAMLLATVATISSAHADTAPPWEPDAASLGTVTLYDASGEVVTGGSDLAHIADYASASTDANVDGATRAVLYFGTPQAGVVPANWNQTQGSVASTFPNASYPAAIAGPTFTKPVAKLGATEANLTDHIASYKNVETTAGYVDLYQVQVRALKIGTAWDGMYWSTTVAVNTVAGTWTQVYPAPVGPVTTTTAVSVTPGSPVLQGTTETVKATVSPSTAAGSVEFFDGATSLGTQPVTNGSATLAPSVLSVGTHTFKAVFTPTDSGAYKTSTSADLSYVVNAGVAPVPTGGPVVTGTSKVGYTVACASSYSGATAVRYQWRKNGAVIGGATGTRLALSPTYYNRTVSCTTTATNAFGTTVRTSPGRKVVIGNKLRVLTKPVLSGTFKYKKTVSVSKGRWSPSATVYTYQWKKDGKNISGARSAKYKIKKADRKHKLTCVVTAKRTGYANGVVTTSSKKVAKK